MFNKLTFQKWFLLQWHITAKCDQRCKHCYMPDERTYEEEIQDEITLKDSKKIIDSLIDFCSLMGARPGIIFTGGDPLLHQNFFDILQYAYSKGIHAKIMGNPFHLDKLTISHLKKLDVWSFQLSIDGMQEMHDWLRKPGSFMATLKALNLLKISGLRTVVMFTLSKKNMTELQKVMSLVNEIGVDAFAFARLTNTFSNEFTVNSQFFTPNEYKDLLLKYQKHSEKLLKKGTKTLFNRKDHLFKLLLHEQGKLKLSNDSSSKIISGCHIGRSSLSILANGTVFACRRFYSPIGKVPDQSILEIFVSKELDKYRHIDKLKKCHDCLLLKYCRGCPAVAYSHTKDYTSPDPHCWKKVKGN